MADVEPEIETENFIDKVKDQVTELVGNVKTVLDTKPRKQSTLGFSIAAAAIFLERLVLIGQVADDFARTDWVRWLLITFALPLLILSFAILANIRIETKNTKMSGILETLTLTVYLISAGFFLYTVLGETQLFAAIIMAIYPLVIFLAAIYAIASRMD